MAGDRLLSLVVLLAVLAQSGWAEKKLPATSGFPDMETFASILHGSSPRGREMLADVATGPQDLARQKAAARREGIPLTPAELRLPSPPPDQDAAPIWERLTRLLREKPLDDHAEAGAEAAAIRLATGARRSAEDAAAIRKLLADRQDGMTLVHQAVDRPRCVFQRDWALGPSLLFPEYAVLRDAARLLRIESVLLAYDHHYREAIANQEHGFRIAEHLSTDRLLICFLVARTCDRITLAGMEDILYMAGRNAEVDEQVEHSIAAHQHRYPLRHALEGEVVGDIVTIEMLRSGGIRMLRAMSNLPRERDEGPAHTGGQDPALTPAMRPWWNKLLDAGEADVLRLMRRLIVLAAKPYQARKGPLRRLNDEIDAPRISPVAIFRTILFPVLDQVHDQRVLARARQVVDMAGAAVLAYRGRKGGWPEQLDQALSPTLDPFSSRPLGYRREEDRFVVYSVGPSGRFDGGRPAVARDASQAYFRYPAPRPQPPTDTATPPIPPSRN